MHRHFRISHVTIQVLFLTTWVWGCGSGRASGDVGQPDGGAPDGDWGTEDPVADPPPPPPPCALDLECPAPTLCLDGACAGDPLSPPGCAASAPCPPPLACGVEGVCGCDVDAHCPPGFACAADGRCDPGTSLPTCAADADCEEEAFCHGGVCLPLDGCAAGDALALEGPHRFVFDVPVRDALPPDAAAILGAVATPFRVLAGDGLELDLGLPPFVERLVAQLARAWAERRLAPWHRAFLGLVADADDLLSTWRIEEEVRLDTAPAPWRGAATATATSLRLSLETEERRLVGTPEEVLGIAWSLAPAHVSAACGHAVVAAREADVPLGALVVWLLDRLVEEASDGRHTNVDEALAAVSEGFCDGLAADVGGAIGLGVSPVLADACQAELDRLRREELDAIRAARLGATRLELRGHAPLPGVDAGAAAGVTEATLGGRSLRAGFALDAL